MFLQSFGQMGHPPSPFSLSFFSPHDSMDFSPLFKTFFRFVTSKMKILSFWKVQYLQNLQFGTYLTNKILCFSHMSSKFKFMEESKITHVILLTKTLEEKVHQKDISVIFMKTLESLDEILVTEDLPKGVISEGMSTQFT